MIRHGETAFNRDRVMQPADTPLSDRGEEQALRLAQRLSKEGITRILASDLPRAAMTAQALSDEIGVGIEFEPLLRERNFGRLRGQRFTDLEAQDIDPFAEKYPTAPAYIPLLTISSSLIICIARILGAPDTVPAGNPPARASIASKFGSIIPSTLDTICMTWE